MPELARHIPVFLNTGDQDPVGFGHIEDDKLVIEIEHALLVDNILRLSSVGDIRELFLGLGFPISLAAYAEPQRASDDATLAQRRQAANEATKRRRQATLSEALDLKEDGKSNAEIAEELSLSEATIRRILEGT